MPNTLICADQHFGHRGITQFLKKDGTKVRPWDTPEEMDEALVANWNNVVRPNDKVYILGDVVINRKALALLSRLNGSGRFVLIRGNHDIFKMEDYTPYFRDLRAYHVMGKDKVIMSHIPVHTNQLERWRYNIHGHTHTNNVLLPDDTIDERYICVCMEQIDYTPIPYDEIRKRFKDQNETI